MNRCGVKSNKVVTCEGEYMPSQGCCLRHAVLFDIWIAEFGGHRVYGTDYPRRWKRSKFHKWLNSLTPEAVEKLTGR